MSKYLEKHDGDGVVLYYCFLKHFAGATKANIIAAYAELTEAKNQEFSNYVHNLYREYRSDGPAASWSMFQLLDTLDQEYERLQALNRWEP